MVHGVALSDHFRRFTHTMHTVFVLFPELLTYPFNCLNKKKDFIQTNTVSEPLNDLVKLIATTGINWYELGASLLCFFRVLLFSKLNTWRLLLLLISFDWSALRQFLVYKIEQVCLNNFCTAFCLFFFLLTLHAQHKTLAMRDLPR